MTKIIIDSNIAFSAILNFNSRIGQIIINGSKYYDFYSPEYIRGKLWTGDKKLIKGLTGIGFKRLITTDNLYEDFIKKDKL